MQGIRFRKYIRDQFFDLELFARDLADSIHEDGSDAICKEHIVECFETAQVLAWAEEERNHQLNSADGCFSLYSHAMGLIGSRIAADNPSDSVRFYRDDVWIDESWPNVEAVINHLNAQLVKALANSVDDVHFEEQDTSFDRENDFIQSALQARSAAQHNGATVYKIH